MVFLNRPNMSTLIQQRKRYFNYKTIKVSVITCFFSVCTEVQMVALGSLMKLAPYNPLLVAKTIQQWMVNHKRDATPDLHSQIDTFLDCFKSQYPFLSSFNSSEWNIIIKGTKVLRIWLKKKTEIRKEKSEESKMDIADIVLVVIYW